MSEVTKFYAALEPIFFNLLRKPDIKSLSQLLSTLEATSPSIIKIEANRLYPILVTSLKCVALNDDSKAAALNCLTVIFKSAKINNVKEFFTLYLIVCSQIYEQSKNSIVSDASDELKHSCLYCLTSMFENAEESTLEDVYNLKYKETLSPSVLMSILIAKNEKCLKLRLVALRFILTFSQYSSIDADLEKRACDILLHYIPGLVAPLCDIITKEKTVNHQLIELALQCWCQVMCVALKDIPESPSENTDIEKIKKWMDLEEQGDEQENHQIFQVLKESKRTKEWVKAAVKLLGPMISSVSELHRHQHPKVRQKLAETLHYLTTHCSKSLGEHIVPALDALMCLKEDVDVKNMPKFNTKQVQLLTTIAQTRLPNLSSRFLRSLSDQSQVYTTLTILVGYLELLKSVSIQPRILSSPLHLENLVKALTALCKLTNSPGVLRCYRDLQESGNTSSAVTNLNENKNYQYLDSKTLRIFTRLCSLLGAWKSQALMELLLHPTEVSGLVLLAEVVSGWSSFPFELTSAVLDTYLSYIKELFECEGLSPRQLESKIWEVALSLEGIGRLADSVGASFEKHLLSSLFYVIAYVGNNYAVVRTSAKKAMESIATACQKNSSSLLVNENVDYIVHHALLRLRRGDDKLALSALRNAVRYSPENSMLQLEEIIHQILVKSSKKEAKTKMSHYLQLFLAVTECAASISSQNSAMRNKQNRRLSAAQILRQYIEKVEKENQYINEEDINDGPDENAGDETSEKKEVLPTYAALAELIVRRSLHLLAVQDDKIKLMTIDVLCHGVQVLGPWEDHLLPLVHEIWSPLVARFSHGTPPIVMRASFRLLCVLADLAKDFIRSRTLKEVLPGIRDSLIKSADLHRIHAATHTTQLYKCQKEVLSGLGHLAVNLQLMERETDCLVEAAIPYLNNRQPRSLQNCSVELLCALLHLDPCLVVYRLQYLRENKLYSANVDRILRYQIE